ISPFNFPILKTEAELKLDLDDALKSVPFIFTRAHEVVDNQIEAVRTFIQIVKDIRQAQSKFSASKDALYRNRFTTLFDSVRTVVQSDSASVAVLMNNLYLNAPFAFGNENWNRVINPDLALSDTLDLDQLEADIIQICRNRWAEGIYDINLSAIISSEVAVSINAEDAPELTDPGTYNDLQQAWTRAKVEVTALFENEQDFRRELGYGMVVKFMEPNLIYDKETTERRQNARIDRVPLNRGIVLKNERIVDRNTRITEDVLQKLNSLSLAVDKRQRTQSGKVLALSYLGRLMVIGVIISFFFTFLVSYRTNVFNDWKMILLISLIFVVEVALAYLFAIRLELSEYLIPITVGALVLTIMFDARIGFMGTTSIVLMVGLLIGNNVEFIVTSLFTSSVGIYSVRNIRTRSQLFTAIFALLLASGTIVLGHGLFKGHEWNAMGMDMIYLTVISILAPIVTYGFIGLLEISFGVTTNLTLIELLDFQHPLLKRLQQEANGTFNHSIVVGNLAEASADAIGANSLLCRVGAYYHDVGKMVRPEYFIENQYAGENKHDKLTPVMSAKIIKNHVTEGLALAKEYGLPAIVSDFIPMHHGTSKVEYFYRVAKAEADDHKVEERAFTYPGPKPNSKETGILMLCEAIEAAVRSLKTPDIFEILAMIDKIIDHRIRAGQLDNCPLTPDELSKIKGSIDGTSGLIPVLRGIYHIRIEYPEDNGDKQESHRT
ncbi:MAG: HDIG domain-containing metalloprotein, partial [Candidatus Neomarinimicrobiota bacterium]